jgi:hypothetical protein
VVVELVEDELELDPHAATATAIRIALQREADRASDADRRCPPAFADLAFVFLVLLAPAQGRGFGTRGMPVGDDLLILRDVGGGRMVGVALRVLESPLRGGCVGARRAAAWRLRWWLVA